MTFIEDDLPIDVDLVPGELHPEQISRRPEVLFTKGYLENPIKFIPDSVILDDTAEATIVDAAPNTYERDLVNFLVVEVNSRDEEPKYLNVVLFTSRYTRQTFNDVFDTDFEELT